MWHREGLSTFAVGVACLAILGCGRGDGPELATVSGTVTFDGKPVEKATVLFQPESGRPSFGVTDSDGKYSMGYTVERSGVMLGNNTVIIRTEVRDDSDRLIRREFLPKKYHDNTELSAVVEPKPNVFDFELTSE